MFEYLVIDGASQDGTREWLQQQKSPGFCWISEPDSGVYAALNKGVALARGEFLYFLGAGDRLLPNVLVEAARFIAGLPQGRPRFVYGKVRLLAERRRVMGGHFTAQKICGQNISHQAIFYDRAIFARLGVYELKYPIYSDWAFNLRCFGDPEIDRYYWDEVIAEFSGGGLSDTMTDLPFAEDRLALICQRVGRIPALRFRLEQKIHRVLRRVLSVQ